MKFKNNTLRFLFLACVLFSCNDDFVEIESTNVSSENYFNNEEEYQLALIGAYDLLQSTYLNVMLGEIASDNTLAGGENATDVPGIQQVDDMIHTTFNSQLRDIFNWMFAGVNRANYILEFQDKTDFEGRTNIIAQTRFLRAYYYFELIKWFGDVPLVVDQRFGFGDQFAVDRTPVAEIYAQIELDLQYAAENLPITQPIAGQVTQGAAKSLLGKILLFQEKFSEAATVLDEVITSGTYDLVVDYSTLFENDNVRLTFMAKTF